MTWTPSTPAAVAPQITSVAPPGSATVGVPYTFTMSATGTAPISFAASGLPPGLQLSTAGAISGTPLAAGNYAGTIAAANGTLPNASQAFAILVGTVPVSLASIRREGSNVILDGSGPPNGIYAVLGSAEPSAAGSRTARDRDLRRAGTPGPHERRGGRGGAAVLLAARAVAVAGHLC